MAGVRADSSIRYDDLGPLMVEDRGQVLPVNGRRLTAALSILLVNLNQRVSTDALVDALWGETAPHGAETTLDSHLYRLRKLLEPRRERGRPFTTIVNESGGYRLVAQVECVASARFEELAGDARDLAAGDQPRRALVRCDEALALWRGRPWTPHSDEGWALAATNRLEELHAQVRERRVDSLLGVGESEQALLDTEALIAEYPLRERVWALRMLAAYRLGRTDDALSAFQTAREILAEELGVDPGAELQQLQQRILAADPALAPRRRETVTMPPAGEIHLPRRRGSLYGRDKEIDELRQLVTTQPLVTVVGPVGGGKSRVVVEAARAAAPDFPDGVWYVDATTSEDSGELVTATSSALGLELAEAGTPRTALRAYLRNRHLLLLVDSAPASVPLVAELVEFLITTESEAAIVVTSREPLGIDDEWVWPLAPLVVPVVNRDGQPVPLEELAAEPSVQLFLSRANAVGAALDESDLAAVARVCAALDGLPLAIELAAAQARSFTMAEILANVGSDAALLRGVGQVHPTSLADVVQQSVDLLDPTELVVYRAASVVPGEFTSAALAAIADLPANVVRNALAALVHRSLLIPLGAREAGGASRFAQLTAIRSHAHASTPTSQRIDHADRRNAWVSDLVADRPRVGTRGERDWYHRLDDDQAAVRGTLQDTLVDRPSPVGSAVAARLGLYWLYRGREVEWERWEQLAMDCAAADPFDRLLAQVSLAGAVGLAGRSDLSASLVEAAESYDQPLTSYQSILLGEYMFGVANASRATRDFDLGARAATEVGRLADRTNDDTLRLFADIAVLLHQVHTADPGETLSRTEVVYDRALALANDYAAWSASTVGSVAALRAADPDTGLRWSDRTISHQLHLGAKEATGPLTVRGTLLAMAGHYFEAATILTAARVQSRRGGQRWPRVPSTWEVVALVDGNLSGEQRDRASQEGSRLVLAELPLPALEGPVPQ